MAYIQAPQLGQVRPFNYQLPTILSNAVQLKRQKQLGEIAKAREAREAEQYEYEKSIRPSPQEIKAEKQAAQQMEATKIRINAMAKALDAGTPEGAKAVWNALVPPELQEGEPPEFKWIGDDEVEIDDGQVKLSGKKSVVSEALKGLTPEMLEPPNLKNTLSKLAELGISVEKSEKKTPEQLGEEAKAKEAGKLKAREEAGIIEEGKGLTPSNIETIKNRYVQEFSTPSTAMERFTLQPRQALERLKGWLRARENETRLSESDLNEIENKIITDLEIGDQELLADILAARAMGAPNDKLTEMIDVYMGEHPEMFPPSAKWQMQPQK